MSTYRTCQTCTRSLKVRKDGTFPKHLMPRDLGMGKIFTCPMSRKHPQPSEARVVAIRGHYTTYTINPFANKKLDVQGARVADLKIALRGVVPQDQRKFVKLIESLGLEMTWSDVSNAYIVHGEGT